MHANVQYQQHDCIYHYSYSLTIQVLRAVALESGPRLVLIFGKPAESILGTTLHSTNRHFVQSICLNFDGFCGLQNWRWLLPKRSTILPGNRGPPSTPTLVVSPTSWVSIGRTLAELPFILPIVPGKRSSYREWHLARMILKDITLDLARLGSCPASHEELK